MLGSKTQYSLKNAESYFREHLKVGDYYMEGRTVSGEWIGDGAKKLNLSGVTTEKDFINLCRNVNPQTEKQLTPRMNGKRISVDKNGVAHEYANRRVFFDFTLSPPKSVSIAALVGNDKRIIEAHDKAIRLAMAQFEAFAATRVRLDGQYDYRRTSNLVGALFRHDTSRALDPHLHSHCILFNATFDATERRWKALETCEMFPAQKFIENVYYHELVKSLQCFGYRVQNNPRGDFEIEGVSQELIDRFSKRHREIDEKTKELLECEPDKANQNIKVIRANIAHKERARKIKDVGFAKLQSIWNKQLSWGEWWQVKHLAKGQSPEVVPRMTPAAAIEWAENHLFERRSVVHLHELWRHALEHARGQNVSISDIQNESRQRDYIHNTKFPAQITTRKVLEREAKIVTLAQHRMGEYQPLAPKHRASTFTLDDEQRKAVEHILSSRDFVTLFRGGAGTGKSYTLREVKAGLEKGDHPVKVIAPQHQQVDDLKRDGFIFVQTVSAFLSRGSMPRGAVILVDEAGQIGGEQMEKLLLLVKEHDGRLVLSGDTRQHGAVEASDALRAIEKYSGLGFAVLTNIRRQNPETAKDAVERQWLTQYRLAVNEARQGKLGASFDRLDKHDAIISCTLADQQQKLTEHFLEHFKYQQSTVIVSQSWSEIRKVNERVREGLKAQKLIGEKETAVTTLERIDLTDAQKRDKRFYNADAVLVFNRPVVGFKQGNTGKLCGITDKHLLVESENCIRPIPFKHLDKITVCQPKELSLSAGDRLQLKANDKSQDGGKLANGELVTVKEIHADGRIALDDGRVLPKHYCQFVRGYAVTSYAAQGKTVDYVLFSDSAVKAATNQNQWYVTISRGRKGVKIFTADKIQLRENIARSGDRTLALDMAQNYFHRLAAAWGNEVARSLKAEHSSRIEAERQAEEKQREREAGELQQRETIKESLRQKQGESAPQTETEAQKILRRSKLIRRSQDFARRQNIQRGRGIGI
jgi:conjugative relaxase-like TrwC/TraI family protein